MNFSASLLPPSWLWGSHILYLASLLWAIREAPWYHLKDAKDAHLFFGSSLILWLIWHQSAGVTAGMEFHLLLITAMTLMFGWPFAIVGASLAQLGLTIEGEAQWATYSLNTLCNGVIPAWISYGIYWLAHTWLPRHFFIYIYVTAFAGGALAMLASRLIGLGILLASSAYSLNDLGDEPLFILVMLFPEAFTNGLLMTALVVYCPQWVSSFSDKCYLDGK